MTRLLGRMKRVTPPLAGGNKATPPPGKGNATAPSGTSSAAPVVKSLAPPTVKPQSVKGKTSPSSTGGQASGPVRPLPGWTISFESPPKGKVDPRKSLPRTQAMVTASEEGSDEVTVRPAGGSPTPFS